MNMMRGVCLAAVALLSAICFADQSVYTDQLNNGWVNWSWATTNLASTGTVHSGKDAISVQETGAWQALYLHHNAQSTSSIQALQFWINGGQAGGQTLNVYANLNGTAQIAYSLPALKAKTWLLVTVPLVGIGASNVSTFDGFTIQDRSGTTQGVYFVDDISLTAKPKGVTNMSIYADALANSWANRSWASTNLSNRSPVHTGAHSISIKGLAAWDALYLGHAPLDGSLYQTITFWIDGGALGGQQLAVFATASGVAQTPYALPSIPKNTWKQVTVPLSALGVSSRGDFDGIWIEDRAGALEPTYYVDDVVLSVSPIVNATANIEVNPATIASISPLIYGVNSTDFAGLGNGFKFTRQGGNRLTAYNWENNASNAGSDWLYQNDDLMGSTNEAGWAGKTFVQAAIAAGATPLVTIPMVDYVAADKLGGGDVRNSGANYLSTRFKQNVAAKGKPLVYPPDATDALVYEDEFVNYIKQFGTTQNPVMYDLDNEPDLWSSTHAEVHPNPVTYAELLTRSIKFSTAIKNVAPNAVVFGPVSYGWYGYRALQGASDANGRDFLNFYLQGMSQASTSAGKRLLDVLDLHWYPEATGDGIRITTDADSPGLSQARIQAPRSLWDAKYVENSWITQTLNGQAIQLLPDTFARIRQFYPGTKLSFTEYNYGGGNAISGAIAQADVLGIFGRYGVYAAANWGLGSTDLAELAGFRAFVNYDRRGSTFAANEVPVTGETPSDNSVYAAVDKAKPTVMTLVVINKTQGCTPFKIKIDSFAPNSARAFTVSDGHYTTPITTTVSASGGIVTLTAPPQSVTTVELKKIGA
ncbi:MAG: glycoside hydrolase family 44 protein [Fimbriimonas sp.]|nr:glycoside hydrolase family 44 protein [Fimbriimonas sp.]